MARFTTLYSGSSGNCALFEEDGRALLIDMGRSARSTKTALASLGVEPDALGGILVTHEHSDHVAGLNVFLKHHRVPVYASERTLAELTRQNLVPETATLIPIDGETVDIAGFGVSAFPTSHDAVDCHGFRIESAKGRTLAIATDLGYVSDEVMANLYLADVVALESNYDVNMLMTGKYPYFLKRRIASKNGHLCNEESAAAVTKLVTSGCKRVHLCHLSKENNLPELAMQSVRVAMLEAGVVPDSDCVVRAAERFDISPVWFL